MAELRAAKDSIARILPDSLNIDVPFFCQAPFTNKESWDVHRESCEEASVLQVIYYNRGVKRIDLHKVDKILVELIDWQMKRFKGHFDLRCDSVKWFTTAYFGLSSDEVRIIRKAKIQDIKQWLFKGFPVIAMTSGYTLNNPHYVENLRAGHMSGYHMLVVKGYTPDRILTNDVGTMYGKDYWYRYDQFQKAMDDHGGDVMVIIPKDKKEIADQITSRK